MAYFLATDSIEELIVFFRRLSIHDELPPKRPCPPVQRPVTIDVKDTVRQIAAILENSPLPEVSDNVKTLVETKVLLPMRHPIPPPSPVIEHATDPQLISFGQLPGDILYHLFFLVRTDDPEESLQTTVTWSHVCSHWRAVATGASLLWTHMRVTWNNGQQQHYLTVNKLLSRSQRLPFTLHLVINNLQGIEKFQSYWINILSIHSHRVRTLVMTIHPSIDYESTVRTLVSPLQMPNLAHFYLDVKDFSRMRCSIHVKPRERLDGLEFHPAMPRYRRTPYLDWTVKPYHITSLSIKCVLVMARDLFPVLIMSHSTLTHLEYYTSNCHPDWEDEMPRITLPKLTSLHLGYGCVNPAHLLVRRLILPVLSSVLVHDFRRCPAPGMPTLVPAKINPDRTDAIELLRTLGSFSTITQLTLRGVECFTSCIEEVTVPLEQLIRGLEALVFVNSDSQFLHILRNVTLKASRGDLEGLADIAITGHDYLMVLEYLRLRAARGLPRLRTLSVNTKLAPVRHFVHEFALAFYVRGMAKHKPRYDDSPSHPYLREARSSRQGTNMVRGLYSRLDSNVRSL
ncbi:hypothetical protein DXG01_006929 [Tephrocybe rancida]|nr:hypothetical protein DXG01_006929 [Tephrocybe rancida]